MTECRPRWASPRTTRRTFGPAVVVVAEQLGLTLLPWQVRVLKTALEQTGGRPAYRDVLVSVPRQSGKSLLALSLILWKLLEAPDQRVLYAAQSRLAGRDKLLLAWWPRLSRSPLGDRFGLSRAYGAETLTCDNGSVLQLLASRESAGHGETVDLAVIDEAWVHQDSQVEQAVRPAMATRRGAQLWAMSTAGTSRSAWWRKKLDAGRMTAQLGVAEGLACFDWSAPDEANPADESTWSAAMPALGRLIDVETVRADLQNMDVAEFARAFLNVWPDQFGEGWRIIPRDVWEAARDDS
jgi:phage terminase large subunit-like protein